MNPLICSSISRSAYNNKFENVRKEEPDLMVFDSRYHRHQVIISDDGQCLCFYSRENQDLLQKQFPDQADECCLTIHHPADDLTDHLHLLGKMFSAAADLPMPPQDSSTASTEIPAEIKARMGQALYRKNLLDNWDNACAVTGLSDQRLLRASHGKPWKEADDQERLDPANGLPLAVHLDVLFDSGLISFQDDGSILFSPQLTEEAIAVFNLSKDMKLRKPLTPRQCHYMQYHRDHIWLKEK